MNRLGQQAEDINYTLLDTIFEGGQIFINVNTLMDARIFIGDVEPTDTPFWYDPTDITTITRRSDN